MKLLDSIKKLCSPAYFYLVISVFAFVLMMLQNAGNTNKYCIGSYQCQTGSTALIFVFKGLYIAFWTFVLDMLCKSGYKNIAWFLVLLPFILFFLMIGLFVLMNLDTGTPQISHSYMVGQQTGVQPY